MPAVVTPIFSGIWLGTLRNEGQIYGAELQQAGGATGRAGEFTALMRTSTHWPPLTAVMPNQNTPTTSLETIAKSVRDVMR